MELKQAKDLLEEYLPQCRDFLEQAARGMDYYQGRSSIIRRGMPGLEWMRQWQRDNGKNPLRTADNRIPANWHRILVDQKVGYLFTYPPRFDLQGGGAELNARVRQCLGDCYEKVLRQLGTDASNAGRGWLCYWYDEGEPFGYWFVDPLEITPVYDPTSIRPRLKAVIRQVRPVPGEQLKPGEIPPLRTEIWTDEELTVLLGEGDKMEVTQVQPHRYGRPPFIEFPNNEARAGDLLLYRPLVDAIDKVLSGMANDLDDIQEILFVIRNYDGQTTSIDYVEQPDGTVKEVPRQLSVLHKAKLEKYFSVSGDGGVEVLKAEIPYEARAAYLQMLTRQLYATAMAVDPAPERTGNQSGVYIEFLYSLLELKAGLMETEFRPALAEFARAILRYLGEKRELVIQQLWTRNKPRNDTEVADILVKTPNEVLSPESKTRLHPLVEDWQAERELIKGREEG